MTTWFDAINTAELPVNDRKALRIEGVPLLFFNLKGEYYAIRNQCTHQDLPLEEGELTGDIITCPFHGASFCIKTGEVKSPPAFEAVDTYPVRVKGNVLQVCLI